ncbi:MAG: hypothetical protein H6737_23830 [Alphaproteobacteria bacterium]|nr:hypothetical protein [Alphaproteobacteria bacterium]
MRSLPFLPALLVAVACAPEQQVLNEQITVEGVVPADVQIDEMTQEFLASGAQFGVIVDPATGDTLTLSHLERNINSGSFAPAGPPTCLDCGDPTCGLPAGLGRQIQVPLERLSGSGEVDVNYLGASNWTPIGQDCDGSSCPTPVASPATFDVVLYGNLDTCSSFAVFFNADNGVDLGTCPAVEDLGSALGTVATAANTCGAGDDYPNTWLGNQELTYMWTAPSDGVYTFDTYGSNGAYAFDNEMEAIAFDCTTILAHNDDTPGFGVDSSLTITMFEGQSVLINVGYWSPGSTCGRFDLHVNPGATSDISLDLTAP